MKYFFAFYLYFQKLCVCLIGCLHMHPDHEAVRGWEAILHDLMGMLGTPVLLTCELSLQSKKNLKNNIFLHAFIILVIICPFPTQLRGIQSLIKTRNKSQSPKTTQNSHFSLLSIQSHFYHYLNIFELHHITQSRNINPLLVRKITNDIFIKRGLMRH